MRDIRSGLFACPLALGDLSTSISIRRDGFSPCASHANRLLCPKFIDKVPVLERQLWDQVRDAKSLSSSFSKRDRDTTWLTIYLTSTVFSVWHDVLES